MRTKTPLQEEKILRVAARLFATHRFHEARLEDIAADAGVGKGTIYRYFKDKEDLYVTLLARATEQLPRRLCESLTGVVGARARLETLVAALMDFFDGNPHLFDLIQHAEVMQRSKRDFPWQKARDETTALVHAIFDEGRRTGAFTVVEPDLTVVLLLGGLRAVYRFGTKPRPADLPRQIVDSLLDGAARTPQVQPRRRLASGRS